MLINAVLLGESTKFRPLFDKTETLRRLNNMCLRPLDAILQRIAAACVFLAAKLEEKQKRSRDVINVFYRMERRRENKTLDLLDPLGRVCLPCSPATTNTPPAHSNPHGAAAAASAAASNHAAFTFTFAPPVPHRCPVPPWIRNLCSALRPACPIASASCTDRPQKRQHRVFFVAYLPSRAVERSTALPVAPSRPLCLGWCNAMHPPARLGCPRREAHSG